MTLHEILHILTDAVHLGDTARGELHAAIGDLAAAEAPAAPAAEDTKTPAK